MTIKGQVQPNKQVIFYLLDLLVSALTYFSTTLHVTVCSDRVTFLRVTFEAWARKSHMTI